MEGVVDEYFDLVIKCFLRIFLTLTSSFIAEASCVYILHLVLFVLVCNIKIWINVIMTVAVKQASRM